MHSINRIFVVSAMSGVLSISAFAGNKPLTRQCLQLRSQPSKQSRVIGCVSLSEPLVSIFHKKGWAKVGLKKNGAIAWVSDQQVRAIKKAAVKPLDAVGVKKKLKVKAKPTAPPPVPKPKFVKFTGPTPGDNSSANV
jgi:hypothetical protein